MVLATISSFLQALGVDVFTPYTVELPKKVIRQITPSIMYRWLPQARVSIPVHAKRGRPLAESDLGRVFATLFDSKQDQLVLDLAKAISRAISRLPKLDQALIYNWCGVASMNKQEFLNAGEWLDKAWHCVKDDRNAWVECSILSNQAIVDRSSKDFHAAIEKLEQGIKIGLCTETNFLLGNLVAIGSITRDETMCVKHFAQWLQMCPQLLEPDSALFVDPDFQNWREMNGFKMFRPNFLGAESVPLMIASCGLILMAFVPLFVVMPDISTIYSLLAMISSG